MDQPLLTYRPGTIKDLSALMIVGQAAYGKFSEALTPDNFAILNRFLYNEQAYRDLIQMSFPFVCVAGEVVIGMAFLIPKGNPTDIYDKDWCYIRMVGVNPAHEGKGIGKKLMQLCMEKARETGEQTVALHTSEFMDAARHIYEKMGFTILREVSSRFGKRYWLYTLSLPSKGGGAKG